MNGNLLIQECSCRLERTPNFLCCLPRLSRILNRKEVIAKIKWIMEDEKKFQSVEDCVLVSLVPELKESCLKYYQGMGPKLNKLFSKKDLKRLDCCVVKMIRTLLKES